MSKTWAVILDFLKFSKITYQHSQGDVENLLTATPRVYLEICQWKNFENRSTLAEVMTKSQVYYFLDTG